MLIQSFKNLPLLPNDPIFAVNARFRADQRAQKVNLGIGVGLNDVGALPVMEAVHEAEVFLAQERVPRGYLPMAGSDRYATLTQSLVFGEVLPEIQSRVTSIQTVGGTGGLTIASHFARRALGARVGSVSNPTWGNHLTILQDAGLEVDRYPYFSRETKTLTVDAMVAHLKALPEQSLVVLHASCHNPTGMDLDDEGFNQVVEVLLQKNHIPLFDMAYQGWGLGVEEDARRVREYAKTGHPLIVAASNSKNFSLYGERVASLHVVCPSEKEAPIVRSHLLRFVRGIYSNPPTHGALVVETVLASPELTASWRTELESYRLRVAQMRQAFVTKGRALGFELKNVDQQIGLFALTDLTSEQIEALARDYGVYGVPNGRLCLAGLNEHNLDYVMDAFKGILHP